MQPVYEGEAITIASNQDGCSLSDFQYTLRDLLDHMDRLLRPILRRHGYGVRHQATKPRRAPAATFS